MDAAGQISTGLPAPTPPPDDHPTTLAPAENLPDDARTLAARASTREGSVAAPDSERLLRRVADELRDSFQNALDKVVADVSSEFGLVTMEKGAAGSSNREGESDAAARRLLDPDSKRDQEDVRRLVQELRSARSRVRELQQTVAALEKDKRMADSRVALHSTLVKKLTRELVDERLAHIDTKREADSLRSSASVGAIKAGSAGGDDATSTRSPPPDREASNNPWTSPGKPVASSSTGVAGSVMSPPSSSKLMGFNFYSSEQQGGEDEPPSPSSSTHTLRGTLMGQFLPSSLLDSPQLTPTHATSFRSQDVAELSLLTEQKRPVQSDNLSSGDEREDRPRSSQSDNQTDHAAVDTATRETKQPHSGTLMSSASSSLVAPLQLSMLSELFEDIPVQELEAALVRCNGDDAAAIDHLVRTHPSFNPGRGVGSSEVGGTASLSLQASSTGGGASHKPPRSSGSSSERTGSGGGGGGGAASTGPGSSNWKTEICMYYMQGKCNKTRRTCPFAHGESDLARPAGAAKAGYKTRLCPAYESGTCPKSRRDCPLAHGVNDLREPGAGSQSSTSAAAAAAAAMAAAIPGGVNNPALLPPPTPRLQSYKTELCYYYLKGNCNYTKEECRFAHGPSDLRTVESNTIAQMNAAAAAAAAFTAGAPNTTSATTPGSVTAPGVPASFDKQLQWQHQYQPPPPPPHLQQQHQQHQQMAHAGYATHGYMPPSHQLQGHRGSASVGPSGGMAQAYGGYQPPPPPPQSPYRQQQPHHLPSPHAQPFRYLKSMEELPKRGGRGSGSGRRDSSSSWSGYDAPGLPPPDF